MEQSTRDKFYKRIQAAPLAAQGFFESVDEHFRPRNDVDVRFTHTNVAYMRLWAIWETDAGKQREYIFATMTWQPQKQAVYARSGLGSHRLHFDIGAEKKCPFSHTSPAA